MSRPYSNASRVRKRRARYIAPALVLPPLAAAVAAAVVFSGAKPGLRTSQSALAAISTPLGSGQVVSLTAFTGAVPKDIPVALRGNEIWPLRDVAPGAKITVLATIKRPGWIAWLAGAREHVRLTVTAPSARPTSTFLTRTPGQPLQVDFTRAVSVAGSGAGGGRSNSRTLTSPQRSLAVDVSGYAGTVAVSAAVRSWERPVTTKVTWFPPGRRATVIATPRPGARIDPLTPITLTFSRPVAQVLGAHRPPVNPITPGVWHAVNSHTIVFRPTGYGYGLGAAVNVLLPADVRLLDGTGEPAPAHAAGGAHGTTARGPAPVIAGWTVPQPSTASLQELLADLGYLPVKFVPDAAAPPSGSGAPTAQATSAQPGVAPSVAAEEQLIVTPPRGQFRWRYPNTPTQLEQLWSPSDWTELTKGAVMAFENDHGLAVDGIAGPAVWKALIAAAVAGQRSSFGYTFVMVSEHMPESISVWHNGRIVVQGAANTGIAAAPTALGTYAVFEHLRVTTMSGLNPDGTPYHDPGIPWVSYFNGGDALHGFTRATYGSPQSLGCVEMPFAEAGAVWPYTPIGTIVNLT